MGFMPWNVKIPIYRDFTDFTQIYSNFTTLRKFYTGFTFWDGLILHSDDKLITISEKKYTECKVYEKKWGGTISERDDENYFRTGRRSGNLYLRHEYDERVPAESSGGKDEENPCPAYKKSDSWCTCRCFDDSGVTEQQRNNGYDNRLCQRRTDVAATGDLHYSRCQYRYDHDGADYCI